MTRRVLHTMSGCIRQALAITLSWRFKIKCEVLESEEVVGRAQHCPARGKDTGACSKPIFRMIRFNERRNSMRTPAYGCAFMATSDR
jgi:hypothetical protein